MFESLNPAINVLQKMKRQKTFKNLKTHKTVLYDYCDQ